MHPIITIKKLALPAFAVEKNGMNMAGGAITIGNVEIKKNPLYEKRQQISVKNLSVEGFGLLIKKKAGEK